MVLILFELLLAYLLHVKGDATQRHPAVGEGKVLSLRHDKDVRAVHFQLVVNVVLHLLDEADESDNRRYADEQPRKHEERSGLSASQVADRYRFECHRFPP